MRILIPDAESGHALGVIQSLLLREGVKIFSLSNRRRNAARFFRQIAASDLTNDCSGDEESLEATCEAARKHSVDIVVPVAERATGILAQYADRLNPSHRTIPIPTYKSFQIATDKSRLAGFCSENGIPCPRTYPAEEFCGMIEDDSLTLEFPVIWKPVRGEGGKGVKLIASEMEFRGTDFETRKQVYGDAVVQEFVDGYDIDLSLLALNGDILAYTIQRGILGRKSRFAAPGGIEFVHLPPLLEVASALTRALGYSGVAHLDFRCDRRDGLFKLVDMNCRFWGSLLGSLKAGVNFPWLACEAGLGKRVEFHGFEESRYFDLLSVLRDPVSALRLKVRPKETNLGFWIRAPWPNAANTVFRRSPLP